MNSEYLLGKDAPAVAAIDFDAAVEQFYAALYRFAFSLSGNASDAADLTQETYRVLLLRAGQIRDPQKIKSWLFTTLYREFLKGHRHLSRFPEVDLEEAADELPVFSAEQVEDADGALVLSALQSLDEKYRTPVALFYLEELSYKEIAEALNVPIGTVMSRLSRGKMMLRQRLSATFAAEFRTTVSASSEGALKSAGAGDSPAPVGEPTTGIAERSFAKRPSLLRAAALSPERPGNELPNALLAQAPISID